MSSNGDRPNPRCVALYVRVSTTRQAEGELSILDQIKQGRDFCSDRGLQLIETFVEPGASAIDDRRPEFQRMMDAACTWYETASGFLLSVAVPSDLAEPHAQPA